MMRVAVHGRLTSDPEWIPAKNGGRMSRAFLVIEAGGRAGSVPLTVSLLAFGRFAPILARHRASEALSVCGRMELRESRTTKGEARSNWSLIAEAIVSARTAPESRPEAEAAEGEDGGTQ